MSPLSSDITLVFMCDSRIDNVYIASLSIRVYPEEICISGVWRTGLIALTFANDRRSRRCPRVKTPNTRCHLLWT